MKNLQLNSIDDINNIEHKAFYTGVSNADDWEHDTWQIKINNVDFCKFNTGLGRRKTVGKGRFAESKPVAPKFADVMYAMLSDSNAGDMTFNDFCSDFGYDIDSRKALDIYLSYQENGKTLKSIFSIDTIEQMESLLENY